MKLHSEGNGGRLHLEGDMTIYHAAEIKDGLLGALAQCAALEIDLSDVTEIDSAGVQLLLLVSREAAAQEKELRILAQSQAVLEVSRLCRLAAKLGGASPSAG